MLGLRAACVIAVLWLGGCGSEPPLPLAAVTSEPAAPVAREVGGGATPTESASGAAASPTPSAAAERRVSAVCVADGGFDDTLDRWSCCSGVVVPGTVVCIRPEDHGGTWDSCLQVCGTRLVGGCVPSGGIDDKGESTSCCSGRTITGSTRCLNPADFGTTWKSCVHLCA